MFRIKKVEAVDRLAFGAAEKLLVTSASTREQAISLRAAANPTLATANEEVGTAIIASFRNEIVAVGTFALAFVRADVKANLSQKSGPPFVLEWVVFFQKRATTVGTAEPVL